MNNPSCNGMGAAGAPRFAIPDWLNNTKNNKDNDTTTVNTSPSRNPGPNARGAVLNATTITGTVPAYAN